MNRNLMIKLGVVLLLVILLLIPLLLIDGVVAERQGLRNEVLQDIARSSSHAQRLTGPLLVVPYRKTQREWRTHEKTGTRYIEERETRGRLYFLPERFALDGQLTTELRSRGIYEARLYHASSHITGQFRIPAQLGIVEDFDDYRFETAFVSLGVSDIRGIKNDLKLAIGEHHIAFAPGSNELLLGAGVHAPLPQWNIGAEHAFDFAFDLDLLGSSQLDIVPVGRETRVSLGADWPHPSFIGNFLPSDRTIDKDGFQANWQTSFFATNMEEVLAECDSGRECYGLASSGFGVSLVDPVDQYLKTDRAIKYALLFICLTFAAFFLFEVLKRLAIHPVQYGLVGTALAMFYLLLVSLSEHLGFATAYAISSVACVLLIGFYLAFVLRSSLRAAAFSAGLAALYGLLYGLLSAEDYALLMGSLLVFSLLACVMLLTRKLDWYGLNKAPVRQD